MDSKYIYILCGCFNDSYKPLSRAEFWKFYHTYGNSVKGIVESNEERVAKLLERSGAVTFAIEELSDMGIVVRTFLDDDYPKVLYSKLKDFCPPLLYICGNKDFINRKYAGYVGSRNIEHDAINWTKMMVEKNIREGFGIVSGGASGIDSLSINHALKLGGHVVAYLPDNIKNRTQDKYYRDLILDGRLTFCSHISPFAKKTRTSFISAAMERNKLIYAQSDATVVVKSDYNKGGTWSGAIEALKHKWSPVFVWDNKTYEGNQRLIEHGGIPISDEGKRLKKYFEKEDQPMMTQITIYDFMHENRKK